MTQNKDLVPEWISKNDLVEKKVRYEFKNRRKISFKHTNSNRKQKRDLTPDKASLNNEMQTLNQ